MKNTRTFLTIFFLLIFGIGFAQVPRTISFQGLLADSSSNPVPDGNYLFFFSVYDINTGGTALWSEMHNQVVVTEGLYNVILGSITAFNINFDKPYYLEIAVGGLTMSPRVELTSNPYILNKNILDLSDGILSGSIVGSGISADSITSGVIANSLLDPDLQDLADGSLSGTLVGSGIIANNITSGIIPLAQLSGITSVQIQDSTLTSTDLSSQAGITGGQILDGTITSSDISDTIGFTGTQIQDGSLTNIDLSSTAGITSSQIASVDAAKVKNITNNYVPRSDGTGLTTGIILDNGSTIGVNTTNPDYLADFVSASGSTSYVAVYAASSNSSNPTNKGLWAEGLNGTTLNYGVHATASGGSTAYGIYARASGSNNDWAGYFSGNVYATGNFSHSDIRFKKDIIKITDPLSLISAINGVYFHWKSEEDLRNLGINCYDPNDSGTKIYDFPSGIQIGIIAQDVEKVIPEIVINDANGFKSVDYAKLTPVLIEAIKEQQSIIESQARDIEILKNGNQEVNARIDELTRKLSVFESYLNSKASVK